MSSGRHSAGSPSAGTPRCLYAGAGSGWQPQGSHRWNGSAARLGRGRRAMAGSRFGCTAATVMLGLSHPLQALSKGSRGNPPWIWVSGGWGCPDGRAWAGTPGSTSLEESAWKSRARALPWCTHGVGSPDAGVSHPELTPGRAGKPEAWPVRPWHAGGCSPPVPARGPSPAGERGGCTAARSSSWVIFMLSEK